MLKTFISVLRCEVISGIAVETLKIKCRERNISSHDIQCMIRKIFGFMNRGWLGGVREGWSLYGSMCFLVSCS
jgi:hypothetical protein